MSYEYTTAEPPAWILQIHDDCIHPARLHEFGRTVENEYHGTIGDDERGTNWQGQQPLWGIELTVGTERYDVRIVKLMLAFTPQRAPRWVLARHYDSSLLELAAGDRFVMQGHVFSVNTAGALVPVIGVPE